MSHSGAARGSWRVVIGDRALCRNRSRLCAAGLLVLHAAELLVLRGGANGEATRYVSGWAYEWEGWQRR